VICPGSSSGGGGWAADSDEQFVPAGLPWPVGRQVQGENAGGEAILAGMLIRVRRIVPVVAFIEAPPATVAAALVRLKAMHANTSHALLALNRPDVRQVGQRGVLQIGIHVFDDRVPAVDLVRGDGVRGVAGGGGEERVEPPRVEQGGLPSAFFGFRSGIRRTINRPGTCWSLRREVKAVKGISATSAVEIHQPVS